MARVEITFFTVGNRSVEGGTMPVPRADGLTTEVVTSGGASTATATRSAAAGISGFARVQTDGDVWVVAGASPTASAPSAGGTADGFRVTAGAVVDLALAEGDQVAVVNI